ncbi:MAG: hypothetical protein GY861_23835 [bacterium]|nr:hypothetical protein [bacterium]
MLFVGSFMAFCAVFILIYVGVPLFIGRAESLKKGAQQFQMGQKMDKAILTEETRKAAQLTLILPVLFGVVGFMFLKQSPVMGMVAGVALGFIFPRFYLTMLIQKRKRKFGEQLVDSLMIMSSSFRGGLSLLQALEAVADEMPDPIRMEFNTVIGESKMGVPLEDAFAHLYKRMPSAAMQQMITAILLARETGGNLPSIFMTIVSGIREHRKIQGQMDALTLQGRIQGVVLTLLPVAFTVFVTGTNPKFFDVMLSVEIGKTLLMVCALLWVVAVIMIWKISTIKEY